MEGTGNNNNQGHFKHLTCNSPRCLQILLHMYLDIKIQMYKHVHTHANTSAHTHGMVVAYSTDICAQYSALDRIAQVDCLNHIKLAHTIHKFMNTKC